MKKWKNKCNKLKQIMFHKNKNFLLKDKKIIPI